MSLGQSVRVQRLLLRMSEEEVASQIGLSRAWLSRVERDQIKKPGWESIEKLARVLGVPPERWLAKAGYRVQPMTESPESVAHYIRQAQAILAEALERVERIGGDRETSSAQDADSSVRRHAATRVAVASY